MPRLKPLRGQDLIKKLVAQGFIVVRQESSHVRLRHPDGRTTTVPVHRGETIGRGLLRKIVRDTGLPISNFQ